MQEEVGKKRSSPRDGGGMSPVEAKRQAGAEYRQDRSEAHQQGGRPELEDLVL